jgi:AcrR family transcriptional regulator
MKKLRRVAAQPMARAAETRRIILGAAGRLFAEKGFAATTISDIAASSGMNRSLVSYHFGSKAGLYGALIESALEEAAAALRRIPIAASDSQPERRLLEAFAAAYSAQPHLAAMLVREHLEPGYLATADAANQIRSFGAMTRDMLRAGRLSPEAAKFDPQVIHLICIGALIYFLITRPYRERMQSMMSDPPTRPSLEEFVNTLAHILSKGIRT